MSPQDRIDLTGSGRMEYVGKAEFRPDAPRWSMRVDRICKPPDHVPKEIARLKQQIVQQGWYICTFTSSAVLSGCYGI